MRVGSLSRDIEIAADTGADIGQRQALLGSAEQGENRGFLAVEILLGHGGRDLLLNRPCLSRQDGAHKTHIHTRNPISGGTPGDEG